MGALQDFLNKNLPGVQATLPKTTEYVGKTVKSAYGGLPGKAFLAADAVAIATADNKLKSILKTIKDVALFRIVWPVALVQALTGVQAVFRHLVIDSGSLAAAIERIKTISVYQGQFEPLLKGVAAAKQRVAELLTFSNKSPFSLSQVVQASRSLEIYTKGAMGAGKSLKLVENIARASGTSIETAADAFGGLYRALQNNEPISQASAEIQRMGLLSAQTAEKIQRLQNTGASSAEVWLTTQEAIKANAKQTDDYANSLEGLTKQLEEQRETNKATFGRQFVPAETAGAKLSLGTAKNLQPVMETLGNTLSAVTTTGENFSKWLANVISGIPGLSTAIGVLAKGFVTLAVGVGAFATGKGLVGLWELVRAMTESAKAMNKVELAAKLTNNSVSFLAKSTKAAEDGHKLLSKGFKILSDVSGKASGAVGGLTGSLRTLAVAVLTNPILVLVTVLTAAAAALFQVREANAAAVQAFEDLSKANADLIHTNKDQIDAIQSEDDAYAALAKTTQDVVAAKKKLNEMGQEHEEAGFLEKVTGIGINKQGFTTGTDLFGFKKRRDLRNEGRENQKVEVTRLEGLTQKVQNKIDSGQLAPNKEKQAVLEEAAARKVRLDQMERENKIQLATGHEKLRLMEQERVIEAGKGVEGEAAATARAKLAGDNEALAAKRGELTDKEIRKRMVANAKNSSSEIIREEQRVREMPFGPEREEASLAVAVKKKDIEDDRTQHTEKAVTLAPAIAQGEMELKLADIRLVAEEKIAELKTVGVERAKEEYAIKQASLEETLKAQIAAGRPEEARSTRAAMQAGRQEQFEQTRGVEVTRAQFQLQLEQHALQREGRTKDSQQLEDVASFLSHFEELRSQFGAPEAEKMAITKRKDELLEEQSSRVAPVVTSSLQSIGGGGGVYGVNADSMQRVQERIRDLTENSNSILQHIEANTKENETTAPIAPTVEEVTTGAETAQRSMVEAPTTSANIVIPGADTIPPNIAITNPPDLPAPAPVAAPAQTTTATSSAVPSRLPGPLFSKGGTVGARIEVPGKAPAIPPSIAITNPPITATAPQATEAPRGAKLEAIDLGGRALDYISVIAKNTGLWSASSQRGTQGNGAAVGATSGTKEERDAMIRKAHGIYGVPKFGLFPHSEEASSPETEEEPTAPLATPGKGGRSFFASHTGDETVDRMLAVGVKDSSINKPAGQEKAELDVLQAKSSGNPLTASFDALQRKSNSLSGPSSAPFSPSPSGLQKALADRETEDPFAAVGPNFHAIQVLRTLKDIHESHMEGNGHLDTIAGKEAGVS